MHRVPAVILEDYPSGTVERGSHQLRPRLAPLGSVSRVSWASSRGRTPRDLFENFKSGLEAAGRDVGIVRHLAIKDDSCRNLSIISNLPWRYDLKHLIAPLCNLKTFTLLIHLNTPQSKRFSLFPYSSGFDAVRRYPTGEICVGRASS